MIDSKALTVQYSLRKPVSASHHSPLAAFCRFWLPFLLPLLVAGSRCRFAEPNHLFYNIVKL